MKLLKRIGIFLAVVIVIGGIGVAWYILSMSFSEADVVMRANMQRDGVPGTISYHRYGTDSLRYIRVPSLDQRAPLLLTIHGAPGAGGDFAAYWSSEQLLGQYEMISIDRPGYGGSSDPGEDVSIREQSEIIIDFIRSLAAGRPVAILSHSFGGPIGALTAIGLDTLCMGHVMVAPVIDPYSEETFWYSSIPLWWPFSAMASRDWRIAAYEKASHADQTMALVDHWADINSPTVHIHGESDWLAPLENVDFCTTHFDNTYYSSIIIPEGSHFILWEGAIQKEIIQALLALDPGIK